VLPETRESWGKSSMKSIISDTLPILLEKYQVPGAQLAVHHGGRTEATEAGELAYRTARAVTRDTAFPVGSISKAFTATAAMILIADGDLELDTPIGDYLPELDDECAKITLRQLLSHTSGLGSGAVAGTVSTASPQRYVRDHCRSRNLVLPPGTGFSYSNAGFILAGHLVETISGMSWWDAIESIVLRPLGIDPAFITGPGPRPVTRRPVAAGYSVNAALGRIRPVDQSLAPSEAPAGALAMSALDLVALGLLHVGPGRPDLLPALEAQQMRRSVPTADPFGIADGWGLGLGVFRAGDTEWFGHDGNSNGTSCYLRICPELGCVIAFTSNANTGFDVWQAVLAELAEAGVAVERPRIWPAEPLPAASLAEFAGVYANGDVAYVVTVDEDGQLRLAVDGAVFAQLTCHAGLTFSLHIPTSGQQAFCGRFLRDPVTGRIDRIQVSGRLARRTGGAGQ
jgi:CubicO group peptidase (beta-lactamase class C family)